MKIIHEITLDVSRHGIQASIPLTQHDAGMHSLLIHLRNGSREIKLSEDITATLYVSNDTYEDVIVYTENGAYPNTLECNITPYITKDTGEYTAQLQIYESGTKLFSAPEFTMIIKADRSNDSQVISSPPFAAVITARDAARSAASDAQKSAEEAKNTAKDIREERGKIPVYTKDTLPQEPPSNYILITDESIEICVNGHTKVTFDKSVVLFDGLIRATQGVGVGEGEKSVFLSRYDFEIMRKIAQLSSTEDDGYSYLYTITPQGDLSKIIVTDTDVAKSVIRRNSTGHSAVPVPTLDCHIANKKYVDDLKVNSNKTYANALVGNESGTIIAMDDVSPLEHKIPVKVRSKNLFDISKVPSNSIVTNNGDGTLTVLSYGNAWLCLFSTVIPNAKVGDILTLSMSSDATSPTGAKLDCIRLNTIGKTWNNGETITVTEDMLNSQIGGYCSRTAEGENIPATASNIQVELDTTATPYAPYVPDDAEVTVKSCGKNLLSYPYSQTTQTTNGITFTVNEDGTITANGTATAQVQFHLEWRYNLPSGTYMSSGCPTGGGNGKYLINYAIKDFDNVRVVDTWETGSGLKTVANNGISIVDAYFRVYAGQTVNNLVFKPMLEVGDTVTTYEPYIEGETVHTTVGESVELTSIAPNMTITTDNPSAVVECSYNKDTNAVINNLFAEIANLKATITDLGGTT